MSLTRDEIAALLPFHANGTLDGAERAEVDAALAQDAGLRAELAALEAIRGTLQAEKAEPGPGEFGLARLMREIAREEAAAGDRAPRQARAGAGRLRIWQIAAAVALALFLGQSALLLRGEAPGFGLAGGGAGAAGLTVAFSADATEAEIRALLLSADAEIVGGPSALGLYTVAPVEPERLTALRSVLEGAEIVESVERSE